MSDKINLTPEQLAEVKSFFQQNDFTANMAVEREYNMTGDKAKVFARSKKIFGDYWLGNLRALGVKRQMKNFSKNYPLNFLENADADFVSEKVVELYTDDAALNKAVEMMFSMYAEPIEKGLIGYAGQLGKSIDDLTDEDQIYRFSDYGIQASKDGISFTLKANMGTWRDRVPFIKDDYGIRKITPYECLALQGFPSTFRFANIPMNSAYKQCGNSVVVPLIKRIAEQVQKAL